MSQREHLKQLLENHERRLKKLKEQQALLGPSTEPHILIEIEDTETEISNLQAELDKKYPGSQIIELLDLLDTEPLSQSAQTRITEIKSMEDSDKTIEQCQKALKRRESSLHYNAPYDRGRFHLLLASIYLNEEKRNLKLATKHFLESRDEFHSRQSHLEGLAELGLAITQYLLNKFEEAINTLDRADEIANRVTIYRVDEIALTKLDQTIKKEHKKVSAKLLAEEESDSKRVSDDAEKKLLVFDISVGEHCIGTGGTIDLNLLSLDDYKRNALDTAQAVIIDPQKRKNIRRADYILKIDKKVDRVIDDLKHGDWLLIQSKENPRELNGRKVAVFLRTTPEDDGGSCASLKIFSHAGDHYFLKAQNKSASIVITHYQSGDTSKIESYYKGHDNIETRLAFDVRVSGEVIDKISQESIKKLAKAFIWQVPIVGDIADGHSRPIIEEDIERLIDLKKDEPKDGTYFCVEDKRKPITNNVITYALIRQQEDVKEGEFAAVVITTPDSERSIKEIRKYHLYERHQDLRHWFLEAGEYSSKDLVVIPDGVDTKRIRDLYTKKIRRGEVKFYEHAELEIIGKYVDSIEKKKEE
jgi:SOS-response transcriptional repressor LexA